MFIDKTKNNLKTNLEKAGLAKRDVFIVSKNALYSFVTNKRNEKTPPEMDEARLVECILTAADKRRYYSTQDDSAERSLPPIVDDEEDTMNTAIGSYDHGPGLSESLSPSEISLINEVENIIPGN